MQLASLFLSSTHSAQTSKQYPGSNHQPTSALLPSMGEESFVGAFFYEGIYRQYIGAGCARSEDIFLKVFNTNDITAQNQIDQKTATHNRM